MRNSAFRLQVRFEMCLQLRPLAHTIQPAIGGLWEALARYLSVVTFDQFECDNGNCRADKWPDNDCRNDDNCNEHEMPFKRGMVPIAAICNGDHWGNVSNYFEGNSRVTAAFAVCDSIIARRAERSLTLIA